MNAYVKRVTRLVTDEGTGELVERAVPVQFRRWWQTDDSHGIDLILISLWP